MLSFCQLCLHYILNRLLHGQIKLCFIWNGNLYKLCLCCFCKGAMSKILQFVFNRYGSYVFIFFRQNHQLQSMRQSLYNERKKFDLLDFVVSLCLFICMHMHLRINLYDFSSSKLPHCSSIYMFTHCLPVSNHTVLIITLLGPGSTSSCTDKVNCAQYGTSFCSDPSYTAFTQENCPKHCNMCSGTGIIQRDKHVVLSMFVTAIHFHHVCCQKYNFVVDPSTCQHLLFLFTRFGLLILGGTGMGEYFKYMYKRKMQMQKIGCWFWCCHGN